MTEAPAGQTMLRRERLCDGCGGRMAVGEPKATSTWPARLSLTQAQVNALIEAAAEYEEFSEEMQHISNAVEFLQWVKVDALPGLYSRDTQRERRDEIRKAEKAERDRLRREVA